MIGVIRQIHEESRNLRLGASTRNSFAVEVFPSLDNVWNVWAGLRGLAGRPKYRRRPNTPSAGDHVERCFHRDGPNQLWVTDITEHRTREGKVFCAVVLDVFSRLVVGWENDSSATSALTTNALAMAIERRTPNGAIIHSDQGTQFTSWAFTERAVNSGLVPVMSAVGVCYDNAMIESFWSRMQVELLDRKWWN